MSNIKSDSAASYMYPTFTSSIITGENAADAVKQERCDDTTLLMRRRDQKLRSWLSEIESLLPAAQYAGLSQTVDHAGSQSHSADSQMPVATNTITQISHDQYFTITNTTKTNDISSILLFTNMMLLVM